MSHRAPAGLPKRTLAVVAGLGMVGSMLTAATATASPLPADSAGTSVSAADFEAGSYIVLLNEAPLASYDGTAPAAGEKLDVTTSAAQSYAAQLAEAQDAVLASVDVEPTYRYDTVLNGFAATLTAEQAASLANNPAVKSVSEAQWNELHSTDPDVTGSATPLTDVSPDFLGVRGEGGLWEQLGGAATAGEGLVVGVLDTGLAYDNESFTEGTVGAPPADWAGDCDTGEDGSWPADACSNKVIGANYFVEGLRDAGGEPAPHEDVSPSDVNGHGSHTAGTAAGFPLALSDGTNEIEISGMAPAAHISVYKVCWDFVAGEQEGATCMNTDSAAAIEKAVEDGVDVLNYSIGSPTDNEYNNGPVAEAFRNAAAAGVYSAVSAGNSGPEGNPPNMFVSNNAPWVTTVAAATHRGDDAPQVAGFSSRGPVQRPAAEQNLLKPDLGAPGVEVLAAVPGGWAYMDGTSMASPHIAGLAVLMKQGHPDWSPMAVKSAMQTTARDYTDAESNDPFNGGVGFVAPKVFLNPGLVFDSGPADWEAFEADYTTGYNYNTASLQIGALGAEGPTDVTRTVTNVTDAEVSYTAAFDGPAGLEVTVSPETVTIPAGESAEVTISVRNVDAPADAWQKGNLSWTAEGQPTVNFPVIARGEQAPPAEEPEPPVDAPEVERIAGEHRYMTAEQLSQSYPDGVDTVFIASGEEYADAMSGSPVAAQGKFEGVRIMEDEDGNPAPVLLAQFDNLTNSSRAALDALAPSNIYILGGTSIISQGVEDELEADYDATVERKAGEDRYETAALLATDFFDNPEVVYVAKGNDDAVSDALTVSALAGSNDAPVLLTKTGSLPSATAEALETLAGDDGMEIIVAGGPAAVSDEVIDQIDDYGTTSRVFGENRWETAVAISSEYAADVPTVYLASGEDYPDALAAAALAGSEDVPVLVTQQRQVQSDIRDELKRLSPERVVIVGGTAALSQNVEDWLNDDDNWSDD